MAPLRDLELTIQSRYPFVAVETSEEDRLEKALFDIAGDLRVPFFVWTVTSGLRRAGLLNAMYDTQQPLRALNTVAAMTGEAMFLMKDLQRYFGEPAVVRKLLDLAPEFTHDRRVIVFSAVKLELPSELAALTALHTLELPGPDELKRIVQQVIVACERDGPVKVELAAADLDRLVERLRGFTAFEAERAVTRAIVKNRSLGARDIETIVEIKKELLKKDGVLEYIAPEENLAEVGGFENLKTWLAKRKKAFAPEAKQFGIESPRGMLLLGVHGGGKTLVARAVAKEWGLPLLKLEAARDGEEPRAGAEDGRADGAVRADDRRAGEGPVLQRRGRQRRRAVQARVRPAPGLAPGPQGARVCRGDLQQHQGAAAGADAQGPPNPTERRAIFAVHLKKRKRNPALFDLDALAAAADGFTGAEIEQAVVSALYTAFSKGTEVTSAIIAAELSATKPLSVTRAEEITALREWARDRTVMAS